MSQMWLFLIIFVNINIYSFTHGKDFKSKHPKVFGGTTAVQSQFPYAVSITPVLKSGRGVSCTGAIITDKWVITAAHCLNKTGDVDGAIVRAAVMDSLSEQGSPNSQDRRSIHFVIHERNPKGGKNSWDVALLEVSEPFVFDEYVRSIALAKKPLPTTTISCVVIGYGFATSTAANMNSYLYSMPTSAGNYQYCNKKNPHRVVGEEYVCLVPDSDNRAMSLSDTGGPLVCGGLLVGVLHGKENNEGVVDGNCVGESCTQVYMFAGYFEPWIREHVANIPEFQPLPEAKLRLTNNENENEMKGYKQIDNTTMCITCELDTTDTKNAGTLKLAKEGKGDGYLVTDQQVRYYAPGFGPCPSCESKGETIKTTFSCITIGMLFILTELFN